MRTGLALLVDSTWKIKRAVWKLVFNNLQHAPARRDYDCRFTNITIPWKQRGARCV